MTTKFDHIRLSRAFRPVVLAAIKTDPNWVRYMTAAGLSGATEDMTKPQVHQACEALGIDLQSMYDQFHNNPANAGVVAHIAAYGETDDNGENEPMNPENDTAATGEAPVGYEGRDTDEVIAEALADASVHMTPYLANMLPRLIRPIVEAAVQGPRTVKEIETVVLREGETGENVRAVTPAFRPPVVRVKHKLALHQAFALPKSAAKAEYRWAFENTLVDVCDYADPLNPVDPDYLWQAELLCELAAQDSTGLNAWIFGAAGTGKTVGVAQYAARLGRPFVRIAIERTTEPSELIGQDLPASMGGWRDGKLTRAFRIPRCVILIDEPTLLRSGTLAVLQTALDMRMIFTSAGETVKAAEGVFIVAADNTAGCGDDTGRYVDTSPVNAAFLDRFALKTEVSWLTPGQEQAMLAHRAGVHPAVAKIMVEFANITRTKADSGHITMGTTPRRLIAWARAVKAGIPSARAWHSCIITSAAPEDRSALAMIEGTGLRGLHSRIDGIVRGAIDPLAPVVPDPVMSAAGSAFPNDNEGIA